MMCVCVCVRSVPVMGKSPAPGSDQDAQSALSQYFPPNVCNTFFSPCADRPNWLSIALGPSFNQWASDLPVTSCFSFMGCHGMMQTGASSCVLCLWTLQSCPGCPSLGPEVLFLVPSPPIWKEHRLWKCRVMLRGSSWAPSLT